MLPSLCQLTSLTTFRLEGDVGPKEEDNLQLPFFVGVTLNRLEVGTLSSYQMPSIRVLSLLYVRVRLDIFPTVLALVFTKIKQILLHQVAFTCHCVDPNPESKSAPNNQPNNGDQAPAFTTFRLPLEEARPKHCTCLEKLSSIL